MLFKDFQWTTGSRQGVRLYEMYRRRSEARCLINACGYRLRALEC